MEKENQWEEIDESQLTIAQRCVYRNRRKAVELYRNGCGAVEIFRATGLKETAAARLWERCRAKDPHTGQCGGYKALVPKSKIKKCIR